MIIIAIVLTSLTFIVSTLIAVPTVNQDLSKTRKNFFLIKH